jgi:hypothetical protein
MTTETAPRDIPAALDYLDPDLAERILEARAAERVPCEVTRCERLATWRGSNAPCFCVHADVCDEHKATITELDADFARETGMQTVCAKCRRPAHFHWEPIA